MDQEIIVLRKLLNGKFFKEKFPMIKEVWVDRYDDTYIDIVLLIKEEIFNEYREQERQIKTTIHDMKNMAGVKSTITIMP